MLPCATLVSNVIVALSGHKCPLLSGVLTQALLWHVDQCMQFEDVVKKIMLAQLARALTEWHCNLFTYMIDGIKLWDWIVANQSHCTVKNCQSHGQKK